MDNNIYELFEKFQDIKKLGYIKSTREGITGVGKTFEDLIGKVEDTSINPDFKGIEIKTKKAYSESYTTLFSCTPKGKEEFEIKRLRNLYGYPDTKIKDTKVLMNSVYGNVYNLIANRYYFKLLVDYIEEKIILEIRDKEFILIEKDVYWSFEELKNRLERKLAYLAFIKAYDTSKNGYTYYRYTDIKFYKLKDFSYFIKLIEKGKIRVTFRIGVFRDGPRFKEIHDRGTSFQIQEKDLLDLFDYINL